MYSPFPFNGHHAHFIQCDTYSRLARDVAAAEQTSDREMDLDALMESDTGEDKTFAAMGVAKTIGTVCVSSYATIAIADQTGRSSPRWIRLLRSLPRSRRSSFLSSCSPWRTSCSVRSYPYPTISSANDDLPDLFDNMYDLVDSLTFKMRNISPNMWPVFELTYKMFKSDAIDFLDGKHTALRAVLLGNANNLVHQRCCLA